MHILIKNKYGSLEIGGGRNSNARLLNFAGLGLPPKEPGTITYSGQSGNTLISLRDLSRTITLSFDFFGGQREIEKIYKLISDEVDIYITSESIRRKISGICINPNEVEKIMYGKWYKLVLQFICYQPYFSDFYSTRITLARRSDKFPNVYENGKWYIDLETSAVATERINKAEIYNRGDIRIYPKIIINNNSTVDIESEAYGIKIINETTGAFIFIEYDSVKGETITVDLPERRIYSSVKGDITNEISDDTVLSEFYLPEGISVISTVNLNSAEAMSVIIEYNNNYVTAVI